MKDKTIAMREAQNKGVQKRVEFIKRILKQMIRNKIKPDNFTLISKYVAEQVSETEGKPCDSTTIRRNKVYRELIHSFMKEMGYEKEKEVEVLSNNVLSLQLRVRELEKENTALEINLQSLLSEFAKSNNSNSNITKLLSNKLFEEMSRVCNIMYRIMQELDAFEVDLSAGEVVDTVSMAKPFTRDEFPEFFKWYEQNIT
jgi:predicted RNase H-like nuclease (RuvC/YqgF family)